MNKNTLYFIEGETELLEINTYYEKKHNISSRNLFQSLLLEELTTLKGRLNAIKKKFNYSYNIPIYINQDMIFFKVFGEHKLWINSVNVDEIKNKENKAVIIFKTGLSLETTNYYRTVKNGFNRVIEISNYKNGLV